LALPKAPLVRKRILGFGPPGGGQGPVPQVCSAATQYEGCCLSQKSNKPFNYPFFGETEVAEYIK